MLFFDGQLPGNELAPAIEKSQITPIPWSGEIRVIRKSSIARPLQSAAKTGRKLPLKKDNPPPATAARL
jgi:hypothetical protein